MVLLLTTSNENNVAKLVIATQWGMGGREYLYVAYIAHRLTADSMFNQHIYVLTFRPER